MLSQGFITLFFHFNSTGSSRLLRTEYQYYCTQSWSVCIGQVSVGIYKTTASGNQLRSKQGVTRHYYYYRKIFIILSSTQVLYTVPTPYPEMGVSSTSLLKIES
jgi:hypothetical protein